MMEAPGRLGSRNAPARDFERVLRAMREGKVPTRGPDPAGRHHQRDLEC